MNKRTDREQHRQIDSQTDGHADTQTHRQAHLAEAIVSVSWQYKLTLCRETHSNEQRHTQTDMYIDRYETHLRRPRAASRLAGEPRGVSWYLRL